MNRVTFHLFALVVLLSFAAATPGTQRTKLGKQRADFHVPDGWRPAELSPNLGPHQWLRTTDTTPRYMVVTEIDEIFLEEADFVSYLYAYAQKFAATLEPSARTSDVKFERRGPSGLARANIIGRKNDLSLQFEFRLFGQNGLAYMVLAWSERKNPIRLKKYADEAAEAIEMPDRHSKWFKGLVQKKHSVNIQGYRFSISASPSLLEEYDGVGQQILGLNSAQNRFRLFVLEYDAAGPEEEFVGRLRDYFAKEWDPLVPLRRESRRIAGRDANVHSFLGGPEERQFFIESCLIQLTADRTLEVRFISMGSDGAHETLRTMIRNSIKLTPTESTRAFPAPSEAVLSTSDTFSDPELERLISMSRYHGNLSAPNVTRSSTLSDQGLLMSTPEFIHGFDPNALDSVVTTEYAALQASYARSSSRVGEQLFTTRGRELVEIENGLVVPTGVEADSISDLGGGRHLLLRSNVSFEGLGFGHSPPTRSQLIERFSSGRERVFYSPLDARIHRAAVSGPHVLAEQSIPGSGQTQLMILATRRGAELIPAGIWSGVETIHEAPGGWLVTGTPDGEALGTYLVGPDASRERLIDGHPVQVVGLTSDRRLLYLSSYGVKVNSEPEFKWPLRSIEIAALRDARLLRAPWSASDLAELTRDTLQAAGRSADGLVSAADWAEFVRDLDARSQQVFDCELPTHPAAVDELIDSHVDAAALGIEGQLLLTALAIRTLSQGGATWVEPDPGEPTPAGLGWHTTWNELAVGLNVRSAVLQCASLDSETFSFVRHTQEGFPGQAMFIGTDSRALRRTIKEMREPLDLAQLSPAGLARLEGLCFAQPKNTALRTWLYRRLALEEQLDHAASIAAQFATSSDRIANDIALSLDQRKPKRESIADRIEVLRDGIADFPDSLDLYVLLGEAYEFRKSRGDEERAMACFGKVVDGNYGANALERAKAGLERLDLK